MNTEKQIRKLNKAINKLTRKGNMVVVHDGHHWMQVAGHFRVDPIKDTLIVENSY